MTKRQAAISVICTYNWCNDGCPMRLSGALCHTYKATDAELIRIAHKEYERKSKEKDGADYMRAVAKEWEIIGKGATVL